MARHRRHWLFSCREYVVFTPSGAFFTTGKRPRDEGKNEGKSEGKNGGKKSLVSLGTTLTATLKLRVIVFRQKARDLEVKTLNFSGIL